MSSEVYTEKWWYERQYKKCLQSSFKSKYPRILKILESNPPPKGLPSVDIFMGSGLYIHGPLGSGKTILAAQIFMEAMKVAYLTKTLNDRIMIFNSIPRVLHKIKTSYDTKTQDSAIIIENLINADLLVLDEFGGSKPSEWLLDILYLIIGGRYDRMKSTIFTSNYDLDKVADFLGDERITSRISRTCEIVLKKPWNKNGKE